MNTKKGFTLAEVLTTLMVIGIVAAMSIPTLMGSTNKQELKVGYKKAIATLNQAAAMNIATENPFSYTAKDGDANNASAVGLANWLAKNLNTVGSVSDDASFTTADGMQFKVLQFVNKGGGENGADKTVPCSASAEGNQRCIIAIDVNGAGKGQNISDDAAIPASNNREISDILYAVFNGTNVIPFYDINEKINDTDENTVANQSPEAKIMLGIN